MARNTYTGFSSGSAYTLERVQWMEGEIAVMIKNSVIQGPDLVGRAPNYISQMLAYHYYTFLPTSGQFDRWGGEGDSVALSNGGVYWSVLEAAYLFPGAGETAYALDWMRNYSHQYAFGFALGDTAYTAKTYIFNDTSAPC